MHNMLSPKGMCSESRDRSALETLWQRYTNLLLPLPIPLTL